MYKGRMKCAKAEVAYPFIKLTYTFSQTHDGKMNSIHNSLELTEGGNGNFNAHEDK
jgi:hypothetical protein